MLPQSMQYILSLSMYVLLSDDPFYSSICEKIFLLIIRKSGEFIEEDVGWTIQYLLKFGSARAIAVEDLLASSFSALDAEAGNSNVAVRSDVPNIFFG